MKIRYILTVCACFMLMTTAVVFAMSEADYKICVGNSVVDLKHPVFSQEDSAYVSIRDICDVLGIPIKYNQKDNEIHADIYNKEILVSDKTERKAGGVIPDEKTALIIGKTILEKYAEKSMEYETDKRMYYLRAYFVETENAWVVVQNFKYKDPNMGGSTDFADFANVKLSKNTGEVMYINTYSTFTD